MPRTISMRSTSSSMMCWIAVVPKPASSMRMPSTRTSACALRPPRMKMLRVAADAAVLRHLESRLAAQQRRQVDRLRVADVLLREHGGMRNGVADALLVARRGDDDGVVLGCWLGEKAGRKEQQRKPGARMENGHWDDSLPRQASPHAGRPCAPSADIRACATSALTVAGAAQVASSATALSVPASRLTRRAEGAAGTELAGRIIGAGQPAARS